MKLDREDFTYSKFPICLSLELRAEVLTFDIFNNVVQVMLSI